MSGTGPSSSPRELSAGLAITAVCGLAASIAIGVAALTSDEAVTQPGEPHATLLVVKGHMSRPIREGERLARGAGYGVSVVCPGTCQVFLHDGDGDHAPLATRPFLVPLGSSVTLDFTAEVRGAADQRLEVLMCEADVGAEARTAALARAAAPPSCTRQVLVVPVDDA